MRVSASKLSLLGHCQFFARPEVVWQRDESGAAAQFGTSVHGIIAATIEGHAATGDQRALSVAATFLEWLDARGSLTGWIVEPAYVLDLTTGSARLVGTNIGRAYPELAAGQIAGSGDLVRIDGTEATLLDVKTGRRENVDPIEHNSQMRTLALAVLRSHRVQTVRAVLAFVTAAGVVTDETTFDVLDLNAWGAELRALVGAIATSEPRPGKHCTYCPARVSCPATTTALAALAPARSLPIVTRSEDFESPDHARLQYLTLRAAKAILSDAWKAVHSYIDTHGAVDLGDGRKYESKSIKRETISLEHRAAVDVLRNELGPAWELAVKLETTKTAIEDAARVVAKERGEKIVAVKTRTLDALRAVGAVNTNVSQTYEETGT